jgi:hypothetical protein
MKFPISGTAFVAAMINCSGNVQPLEVIVTPDMALNADLQLEMVGEVLTTVKAHDDVDPDLVHV